MRAALTIAATQPLCTPHDVAANAREHATAVRSARARLVLFPELSLTGYELDAATVAAEDPRLAPLVAACAETGAVALAGAPVDGAAGRPHIAMLAIDGGGARVVYRKMWLGSDEVERFAPGEHPASLALDGWSLGLAICRDTGVPQHQRDTCALGVDAYLAGVLDDADDVEHVHAKARRIAVERGVWVAFASFAGATGGGYERAAGCSGIWRPDGSAAARAGAQVGALAFAALADLR